MTPPFSLQSLAGPGEPAPATECSRCPAYVVRCAHLEGDDRVVWLVETSRFNRIEHIEHRLVESTWQAAIGIPRADPERSCPCIRLDDWWQSASPIEMDYDDRAEADAAFERFEALLLGRDPE